MTVREKKVYSYMVALSRLYGIVEWKQFIKVFNKYNAPKITKKEILDTPAYWQRQETFCSLYTNVLIYSRVDEDLIDEAGEKAEGKDYYMPSEVEILALSKPDGYLEQTPAHTALYDAIKDILTKNAKSGKGIESLHKMICTTLLTMIASGEKHQIIFDVLQSSGVDFSETDDAQKFLDLLMNAWNNTRMWANRGHTPNELVAKMPKEPADKEPVIIIHKGKNSDISNDFAVQFYKLWYKLTYWINDKYKIVPPFAPLVYGKKVDEKPIIKIRAKLWENPEYIAEYLASPEAKTLSESEIQTLDGWRTKFIKGRFLIHKHLADYSVFQALDGGDDKLYAVHGITNSIENVLNGQAPLMVEALLLPFNGKIVYDTFLSTYSISFGGGMKSSFSQFYREAKEKYGIITAIE